MKSYQYPGAVRDHSKTKGGVKHVFLTLSTYVDDNGECYPSHSTLARDTGLSLRTIERSLRAIPADELQVVEKGRAIGHSTRYRITINSRHSVGSRELNSRQNGDSHSRHADGSTPDILSLNSRHGDDLTTKELPNELPQLRKRAAGSSSSATSSKDETADPPIPLALQTQAFLKAWSDFDEYRKKGKARKEWTPRAKAIALSTCSKLSPDAAVAAIERSIMSGWTGIFAPNNHEQKPKRSTDEFGLPNL